MRNRGAYSTKERMPSDSKQTPLAAWKAVPDWRCTALQAVVGIGAISPAHPRFSRMYGVTNSTVFQTVSNKRFFYDRKAQSVSFFGVWIFYDRRELFCPRISSFRSGSRWVRLIFLGSPQKKAYQKKENSHQLGFAISKAHKRETQGKYFDLFQQTLCYIG